MTDKPSDFELLDEKLTVQAHQQLAAAFTPNSEFEKRFVDWYNSVMKPLKIDKKLARKLFYGEISEEDFVTQLDDDSVNDLINNMQRLSENYYETLK